MPITTIESVRKKREGQLKDATRLEWLGRKWGQAITLPASPENKEIIQAGPSYLAEAADYYAIAVGEEKDTVINHFHEGVRQHHNMGLYQIFQMLRELEKQRK